MARRAPGVHGLYPVEKKEPCKMQGGRPEARVSVCGIRLVRCGTNSCPQYSPASTTATRLPKKRTHSAFRATLRTVSSTVQRSPVWIRSVGSLDGFRRFAWGVLAYNILVILWGAYVRASGSGAGCGDHWPLCNGQVVPRAPRIETMIEYSHRLTSGLSVIVVVGLCAWAFLLFPRGNRVRKLAGASVVFLFVEAMLGAGLVLFNVGQTASVGHTSLFVRAFGQYASVAGGTCIDGLVR